MSPRIRVMIGLALCVSLSAFGKATNIQRGGLGILFPDHNSFANPGQFAVTYGLAIQGFYTRTDQTPTSQSVAPSLVFGNGRFGFGVYGARSGNDLGSSASSTDVVGGGLGISMLKKRITLGASFDKVLESGVDGGIAKASLTFQSPSRKGPSIGAVFAAPVNMTGVKNEVTVGFGHSFKSNTTMEANVKFSDLEDFKNFVAGGYVNLASRVLYLGAGYQFRNVGTQHAALGRLGVMLGSRVDLSVYGEKAFVTGSALTYGGSLRASF